MNKLIFLPFLFLCLLTGCRHHTPEEKVITLKDVFQHPPLAISSVTQSYQSLVTASSITDMNESILCVSSKIKDQSTTYFIQPDSGQLETYHFKYEDAGIVDMKFALLIQDGNSGKEVLFYLPGRFPVDSMDLKPDEVIPVLGISRYHSKVEKISSRWTQIVCKCVEKNSGPVIYKDRTIHECDSGGKEINECTLTTEGSLMTCQTQCRNGAIACCWFEF